MLWLGKQAVVRCQRPKVRAEEPWCSGEGEQRQLGQTDTKVAGYMDSWIQRGRGNDRTERNARNGCKEVCDYSAKHRSIGER